MTTKFWPRESIAPIAARETTALRLVDAQLGFRASIFGAPSNVNFEANITGILAKCRALIDAARPEEEEQKSLSIIHVQHKSVWTDSPMHPSHTGPYGVDGAATRGIDFLEFAAPRLFRDGRHELVYSFDEPASPQTAAAATANLSSQQSRPSELIMTKHGHSPFINTPLERLLNNRGVKTLLIAGMATDGAISTAVRMAHNLALVGKWGGRGNVADAPEGRVWTDGRGMYLTDEDAKPLEGEQAVDGYLVDMPRIVLIGDATRTFALGEVDADVVHQVHVDSLRAFAEVRSTEEVLTALI
ncbi:Isochorismatase-like protein [Moelleriella libera RCEF 2490]|uniref:Isochorismatase-like protein n=1 Tax=Moelleriella libera RCEF 2490 TaxID=1081109 RepID=A0A167Y591_9HYPO|nr:Isochorismatase-like protein [Moelleriella libera RCEF 2490]